MKTLWSDLMVLESVRDGKMMTPAAETRARQLAAQGAIDTSGTWKLTPAGHALVNAHLDNPALTPEDAGSVVRFAQEDFEAARARGGPGSFGSSAREAGRAARAARVQARTGERDVFTRSYIATALWAASDTHGGRSFEAQGYTARDLRPSCLHVMEADCKAFQTQNRSVLRTALGTLAEKGRDFWMARNRLAGPFDFGRKLTEAALSFPPVELELWDGQIVDVRNP